MNAFTQLNLSGNTLTLDVSDEQVHAPRRPQQTAPRQETEAPRPTRRPGGVQHEQRRRREAHIPLFCGEDFADVLVMRQWHLDLSVANIELTRQWLAHRHLLLTIRPTDRLELPGGFFNHIDLRGCYVVASGAKTYWDQPKAIDAATREYWSEPSRLAQLRDLELQMREEITRTHVPVIETVPAFVAVLAPTGRKVPAALARTGVAARRMRLVGCSIQELAQKADTEMVLVYEHTRRDSVTVDCHPSKLANLEVRRFSWRNDRPMLSVFPAFIWRGDEAGMFHVATRKVPALAVPQGECVRMVQAPFSHIGGMPQWLEIFLGERVRFQQPAGFAAHLYRSTLPSRWKRSTASFPAGRDRVLRMVDVFRSPGVPRPV